MGYNIWDIFFWDTHGEISNIYRGIYRELVVFFIFWGPCRSNFFIIIPSDEKNMEIVPIKPLEKVTRVWEDVPSGYD